MVIFLLLSAFLTFLYCVHFGNIIVENGKGAYDLEGGILFSVPIQFGTYYCILNAFTIRTLQNFFSFNSDKEDGVETSVMVEGSLP